MKKYASIDIGTQTIRLLVCELDSSGKLLPLLRDQTITRLGEGLNRRKIMQEPAIQRALACLKLFITRAKDLGVEEIFAAATSCVRSARNGKQFLDTIHRALGILPCLLSGEKEAALTLKGVQSVFQYIQGPAIIIDIGGGSTEIILTQDGALTKTESLPLGVIHLTEKHLKHDPPLQIELQALQENISSLLASQSTVLAAVDRLSNDHPRLVGTAGTITTLAAMDVKMTAYDPEKINGHLLSRQTITNLYQKMIPIPSRARLKLAGLEKGRETVILSGTLVVLAIMDLLAIHEMRVSDAGLLEGVLLDGIEGKSPITLSTSPGL